MEILDYIEREVAKTLAVTMGDYAGSHERAYKFATFLLAGAGASGAYALAQLGEKAPAIQWLPIAVLAVWWCWIAAVLLKKGMHSVELSSGADPEVLIEVFEKQGGNGDPSLPESVAALHSTRWRELRTQQGRINAYREAVEERAVILDLAYRRTAWTPLPALLALGVGYLARHLLP